MRFAITLCCFIFAAYQLAIRSPMIFSADAAEGKALNLCFVGDHEAERLNGAAREACLKKHGVGQAPRNVEPVLAHQTSPPQANFVDLWKAAGQRDAHGNDIRAEQQSDRWVHEVHAVKAPQR